MCRISFSERVVRTASLPLISPSHPLLMFSTESEPCRMCTETSTRSTLLLPGRGSDYIWSINTHWLWEALCLSLFFLTSFPSLCLRLILPHSSVAYYSMTFGHNLSSNLSLMPYFPYIITEFASMTLSRAFYPSVHSFISSMSGHSVTVWRSYSFFPDVHALCRPAKIGCKLCWVLDSRLIHHLAQSSILISQESIGIWIRHMLLKGWPEDLVFRWGCLMCHICHWNYHSTMHVSCSTPYMQCLHENTYVM